MLALNLETKFAGIIFYIFQRRLQICLKVCGLHQGSQFLRVFLAVYTLRLIVKFDGKDS